MRTSFARLLIDFAGGLVKRPRRDPSGEDSESHPISIGDRVLVLRDSHVMSYARNPNFVPMFLAQGRLRNFTREKKRGRK